MVQHAEIDAGRRPGVTTSEAAELKALRQEVEELKRANEILLVASSSFALAQDGMPVDIRDLACFGRTARLRWIKRRWRCRERRCDRKTWTEQVEHLDAQVVFTRRAGAEASLVPVLGSPRRAASVSGAHHPAARFSATVTSSPSAPRPP